MNQKEPNDASKILEKINQLTMKCMDDMIVPEDVAERLWKKLYDDIDEVLKTEIALLPAGWEESDSKSVARLKETQKCFMDDTLTERQKLDHILVK